MFWFTMVWKLQNFKISMILKRPLNFLNDFEETVGNFNGIEETIENFQWFWVTPSPLNVFWYFNYCHGFSMVFGSTKHWMEWFSMVKDHWSSNKMVSMDCWGLPWAKRKLSWARFTSGNVLLVFFDVPVSSNCPFLWQIDGILMHPIWAPTDSILKSKLIIQGIPQL